MNGRGVDQRVVHLDVTRNRPEQLQQTIEDVVIRDLESIHPLILIRRRLCFPGTSGATYCAHAAGSSGRRSINMHIRVVLAAITTASLGVAGSTWAQSQSPSVLRSCGSVSPGSFANSSNPDFIASPIEGPASPSHYQHRLPTATASQEATNSQLHVSAAPRSSTDGTSSIDVWGDLAQYRQSCKEMSEYLSAKSHVSTTPYFAELWNELVTDAVRTFSASDSQCASQWYTWIHNQRMRKYIHDALTRCSQYNYPLTEVKAIVSAEQRTPECDGIARVSYLTMGYNTRVRTINFLSLPFEERVSAGSKDALFNATTSQNSEYLRKHPTPSCSLVGEDGRNAWIAIDGSFYGLRPLQWAGTEMFGTRPPPQKCAALKRCVVNAGEVKLIYFEPEIESVDLCGNDGQGSYRIRSYKGEDAISTQIVSAITFERNVQRGKAETEWFLCTSY